MRTGVDPGTGNAIAMACRSSSRNSKDQCILTPPSTCFLLLGHPPPPPVALYPASHSTYMLSYTLTCGVDQLHVHVLFVSHCGGMPWILLRMLTNHSASENYQACALAIRFGVSLVAIISRSVATCDGEWGHGDDAGTYTCTKLPSFYYGRIDGHQRLLVVI